MGSVRLRAVRRFLSLSAPSQAHLFPLDSCSNGCGMDVGIKDGKVVGVRGRAVDRVNKGRLGPKGYV